MAAPGPHVQPAVQTAQAAGQTASGTLTRVTFSNFSIFDFALVALEPPELADEPLAQRTSWSKVESAQIQTYSWWPTNHGPCT